MKRKAAFVIEKGAL